MLRGWAKWVCRLSMIAGSIAPVVAQAEGAASDHECFDAVVLAQIRRQTPTDIGNCGDDCIIEEWPWILDLDVRTVLRGRAPLGDVTVLTVQHTNYRSDLGVQRWWLRRNALGLFNVLRVSRGTNLPPCAVGDGPATPYISPANGRTIEDVRREGEARYGGH
jgi:hypothetical protein